MPDRRPLGQVVSDHMTNRILDALTADIDPVLIEKVVTSSEEALSLALLLLRTDQGDMDHGQSSIGFRLAARRTDRRRAEAVYRLAAADGRLRHLVLVLLRSQADRALSTPQDTSGPNGAVLVPWRAPAR